MRCIFKVKPNTYKDKSHALDFSNPFLIVGFIKSNSLWMCMNLVQTVIFSINENMLENLEI